MARPVLRVPTTEVTRHFGDYLARVRFGGASVIVLKNDVAVAELRSLPGPEATLGRLLELYSAFPVDAGFAVDLESVSRSDRPLRNPWA
jgi:antitoxin (DNA-binding transcriptional repressor) of toxin-antitoxin stability system